MDDSFVWGSISRNYYTSAVINRFPYYVGDWVELFKSTEDSDIPVAQILYFYQDPLKEPSNFAIVRKTINTSQTKNSQKPAHNQEIFITDQAQTIPLQFIRAKCIVQHKSEILDLENFVSFDKHYFYEKRYNNSNGISDIPPISIHENSPNMKNYLSSHFQFQLLESDYQSDLQIQDNDDKALSTNSISNQTKPTKTLSITKSKKKAVEPLSSNSNGVSSPTEKRKVGRPRKRPLSSIIPSNSSPSPKTTTTSKQQIENSSQSNKNLSMDIDSLENSSNEKYSVHSETEDSKKTTCNGITYQVGDYCHYSSLWRTCIGLIIDINPTLDFSCHGGVTLRLFFNEINMQQEYPFDRFSLREREVFLTDEVLETKILNLGQKCTVKHIRTIEDLTAFVSLQEHFWYEYLVTGDGKISSTSPL